MFFSIRRVDTFKAGYYYNDSRDETSSSMDIEQEGSNMERLLLISI